MPAGAQSALSHSAYRALGQPDLRQNGLNRVEGGEFFSPSGLAIDARGGLLRLYVSDSLNHRVMAWPDLRAYQTGDPPALVLGQPSPQRSTPLGIGSAGLNSPLGAAVDPLTGNLYVADTGNHRVLRFPDPFSNPRRVEPDMVYGQPDFDSRTANAGGLGAASLNSPAAVAFDPSGNLWIADTGNHRVLRYSAAALNAVFPEADLVLGQPDFFSANLNRGAAAPSPASLSSPSGLAFDREGHLYVSDTGNARVLRFPASPATDASATNVYGQSDFSTGAAPESTTQSSLTAPFGIAVSASNLYVAVPNDNRVLVFSLAAPRGAPAASLLGQPGFTSTLANAGSSPRASASTLSAPADVKTDPDGNVYIADSGNHRVLSFPAGARSATQVWGQLDFVSNGVNKVKAAGLNSPYKAAVDYSSSPYALYVSDTNNHRVLVWRDAVRFRTGDPADLVIGQPDMRGSTANADSPGGRLPSRSSLSSPRGIAVDGAGNLFVADTGNNRVLRFPRPVDQTGRIEADAVFGQASFTSSLSAVVNASTLRRPWGVAIGPGGSLFIADTGNNRVLEYAPGAGTGASAVRVFGQPDFFSATAHIAVSPQTLNAPAGLALDNSFNLYAADTGANRVVVFPNIQDAPPAGAAALIVVGNDAFDTIAPAAVSSRRFRGPVDVALDSAGALYVADTGNHRVLAFPSLLFIPIADAAAAAVYGQRDFISGARNWSTQDGLATGESLASPQGLYIDRRDTLYVGDSGNHRLVHLLRAATVAHAANPQASAMPRGGLVTITGEGLSDEEAATEPPLAQALANREVAVNDEIRAPLSAVTPGRISLQLPGNSPVGTQRLAVRVAETGELIAGRSITVTTYSPGLFTRVLNQDGTTNSSANPAARGANLRLTGTGQGAVTPAVADGEVAPEEVRTVAVPTTDASTCLASQPSLCVTIGQTFGEVVFSGLAAGQVGVWQLDVKIPVAGTLPAGPQPLRAIINGQPSNVVTVYVR